MDKAFAQTITQLVEKIKKGDDKVEHGLLQILLPNGKNIVLQIESAILKQGQPSVVTNHYANNDIFSVVADYPYNTSPDKRIWTFLTSINLDGTKQNIEGAPTILYEKINMVMDSEKNILGAEDTLQYFKEPPTNAKIYQTRQALIDDNRNLADGDIVYLRRIRASFFEKPLNRTALGLEVVKNIMHSHPNNEVNAVLSPSRTDLRYTSAFARNKDKTQILYNSVHDCILFYYSGAAPDAPVIVNNKLFYEDYDESLIPKHSAVIAIPFNEFKRML